MISVDSPEAELDDMEVDFFNVFPLDLPFPWHEYEVSRMDCF